MSDLLYRTLLRRESDMVDEIHRNLLDSEAHHYGDLGWEHLLKRVRSLVAYFLMAVRETPDVFVDFAAKHTDRRISAGVRLAERLHVMRLLEEAACRMVVEDIPLPGRTGALARVVHIIDEARDRIAESHAEHDGTTQNSSGLAED